MAPLMGSLGGSLGEAWAAWAASGEEAGGRHGLLHGCSLVCLAPQR